MKTSLDIGAEGRMSVLMIFLVFLVLKLTGVIDWSWWWVAAPIWIPPLLVGLILAVVYFISKRLP